MPEDYEDGMAGELGDAMAEPSAPARTANPTFFISPSDLGKKGAQCSPGDVLRLKVVGVDADDNYEVRLEKVDKGGESEEGLSGELRNAMAESDDIGPVQNIMGEP